ncbi:MAG: hypothetical protein DMG24_12655, partial [Acidobacteria bacterium]
MEPVQVERSYLGCLAHAFYAVSSEGVAAIIDPPSGDVDYLTWRRPVLLSPPGQRGNLDSNGNIHGSFYR